MVFSSLSFLLVFLPILVVLFFVIPSEWKYARQIVLLFFSLIFYGSGEPRYIFLIAACVIMTWILSGCVEKQCKWSMVLAVLINLLPLIITKYAAFIASNVCRLFRVSDFTVPNIVMPIGISFYTFQVITYIVDLYGKKIDRQRNLLLFTLYIMFFPQLIAGPIVKYSEVYKELEKPDICWDNVKNGTGRVIKGLGRKVLIANQAGYIAKTIMESGIDSLTTGMAWLCVVAYTIQIYFDFSGYSEMAIGLGSIFGFHFPQNFNDPYTSTSISEFWRRWHITLGRFFREYVYIPLGGNRVNKSRWVLNILIVWALTGLWHGASWNFVVWGLYYGILIIIERLTGIDKKLPRWISWLVTMFFVSFGWGIFMCDVTGVRGMLRFLAKLLFIGEATSYPVSIGSLKLWGYIPFFIIGFFISTPLWVSVTRVKLLSISEKHRYIFSIVHDVCLVVCIIFSLVFMMGGTYNPFIYFRF